jgi:HupE / UreJ protein
MSEFLVYFQIGLRHILDLKAYDHLLFLVALAVPYAFKDWKKLLLLISIFTLGHTLSLFLSLFEIVIIKTAIIEVLIPITILFAAIYNFFKTSKNIKNQSLSSSLFITLFFGAIHGLGFSNYIKTLLSGEPTDKLLPTIEFSIGIEVAQIIIVLTLLLLSFVLQSFLRISRRDFILVTSALIIGFTLSLLLQNPTLFNL